MEAMEAILDITAVGAAAVGAMAVEGTTGAACAGPLGRERAGWLIGVKDEKVDFGWMSIRIYVSDFAQEKRRD